VRKSKLGVLPDLLGSAKAFLVVFSAFARLAFSLWVILGFSPCFARLARFCEGFFSCFLRFCPACFLLVGYFGIFSLFRPACFLFVGYLRNFSLFRPACLILRGLF